MRKTTSKQSNQEDQLKVQLARALADYDNLRKRVEREKQDFERIANLKLVIKLLPVLETLRRAQAHLKDEGLGITIKEFEDSLAQEGIEEIKVAKGDSFNPLLHEALEVTGEGQRGRVREVLSSGWRFLKGPVIKHAQVKVSK